MLPLKTSVSESTIESSLSECISQDSGTDYEEETKPIHSNITLRPPRESRRIQSDNTSRSRNRAILTCQQNSQNSSIPRTRTSSQPRQSQTTDNQSPMYSSNRSVSQPKLSQNAHFLDGFSVADCIDARKIPDPPPPSPSNTKVRLRRCSSSTVLRPMSSTDVTNRQNHQILTNHHNSSDTKSNFFTRRKRKTLPHTLSLNPDEQSIKPNFTEVNEEKSDFKNLTEFFKWHFLI